MTRESQSSNFMYYADTNSGENKVFKYRTMYKVESNYYKK